MKRVEYRTPRGWAHVEGGEEIVDDFVTNELVLGGDGRYSLRDVPKTNGLVVNDPGVVQWAGGGGLLDEETPLLPPQLNYSGAAGALSANEGDGQGETDDAGGPLLMLPVMNFSPPEKARHNANGRQGVLSPSTTGQRTSGVEEPLIPLPL